MSNIKIHNLTKKFKKFTALNNINLEIKSGRIIGLLGKNGAGKSTLMKCILGFLKFEGEVEIGNISIKENRKEAIKNIAFIPDVDGLDGRLTVQETINYIAGVHPLWNELTASKLLQTANLPLKKKVSKLSKGMKTKLYLILTLSLDVDILLLDEPTLGLDITFRNEFFNTILQEFYTNDKTIIISTHQVEEVENILQDIIFIDNGEIVTYDDIENLKNSYKIVTLPKSRERELESISPKLMTHTLGHVSGIVPASVNLENAEYATPSLSELFLAKVGGNNETV